MAKGLYYNEKCKTCQYWTGQKHKPCEAYDPVEWEFCEADDYVLFVPKARKEKKNG